MKHSPVKWGITSRSVAYAIGVHLVLVLAIGVSLKFEPTVIQAGGPPPDIPAVDATVVTESELQNELDRIKQKEQEKIDQERRRQEELERIKKEAERLEQQRIEEQNRIKELEKQRKEEERLKKEAEKKRIEEEKKAKEQEAKRKEEERLKKLELEKKRKEEEARKKEEEQKQREEAERKKREAEEQKRLEEERKRKEEEQRKEEERKKQEAERKRKEAEEQQRREEERKRREEEARIQAQIQYEQNRQGAYNALGGLVSRIQQAVTRNWIKPTNMQSGLEVLIEVRVTRSGEVISANVVQSSGDQRFDDSSVRAVLKASPLPFPREPQYYEFIRTFNFLFKPEG